MNANSVPKIKDVALEAGVSTATVSRALNKPETVTEETREAVLNAASKIGYRVNIAARNLRSNRTGAVVLLVPNLGNPFFSQILSGIESTLAEERLGVFMVDTGPAAGGEKFYLDYLHHSRADGIICLDGSLSPDTLQSNQNPSNPTPIVYACEWHEDANTPSVRVNNRRGAAMAVSYFKEIGHQNIGFLGGPGGNVLSEARSTGFLTGLQECALQLNESWVFNGDFSIECGKRVADQWINLDERPTAIFCVNDESAIGLISRLNEKGYSVPGDLSVIGFDDIELSQHFIPALTTISQPRTEIGVSAAKLLVQQLRSPANGTSSQEVLPVELAVRGSTQSLLN